MHRNRLLAGAVLTLLIATMTVGIVVRTTRTARAAPLIVKNHRLYLIDTTLGEKRLPTAGDVDVLFDRSGGLVLFGESWNALPDSEDAGGAKLRIMREDGGGERAVTDAPVRSAFFDRSGKTVYYTTADQDLFSVRVDGGGTKRLAEKTLGANLSPDGRSVVYQKLNADWTRGQYYDRALGLTTLDLATGEERRITDDWEDFAPFWSPDGARIVFFSRSPEGLASQFLIGADGSRRRQMTNIGQKSVSDRTVPVPSEPPRWSPDGTKLIYESDREIWLNAFSSGMERVIGAKALGYGKHPEWEADGKSVRVLVGKNDDFSDASVVRIGLDGALLK